MWRLGRGQVSFQSALSGSTPNSRIAILMTASKVTLPVGRWCPCVITASSAICADPIVRLRLVGELAGVPVVLQDFAPIMGAQAHTYMRAW
jgi:hypothetical protein